MRKQQVIKLRRIALKYGISRCNFRRMKRAFTSVPHNKKQEWLRACETAAKDFRAQQMDDADECYATQVVGG